MSSHGSQVDNIGSAARHLTATFGDKGAADRAAQRLGEQGLSSGKLSVLPKGQDRSVAFAEMRDEMEGVAASPGIGAAMTGSMAKGSIAGTLIFTLVGAALGLLAGWLWGGTPSKYAIAALSGAVAGATFGFTIGGFLKPRLRPDAKDKGEFEDEPVTQPLGPSGDSSSHFVLKVRTDDEAEYRSTLSTLEAMSPLRLDEFNPEGEVVSTSDTPPGESDSEGTPPGRG